MFKFMQKIFSSIIGFRTKRKTNIVIASCYYIFFLIVSISMGKGFLFGLVFTFTCPILVFSVIEIITKRKLRPLLDISICFLLIIVFAFTVPPQQTELSTNNMIKQTTTEKMDSTEKVKNNQNKNKEETEKSSLGETNESDGTKQTIINKDKDTDKKKNNQNKKNVRKPTEQKIDENGIIYPINRIYNMGKTTIKIKNVKVKASNVIDYDFMIEYEITNNTDTYIDWEFKYGNYLGKITVNDKTWDLREANWIKDDDIKNETTSNGSFKGGESFLGTLSGCISNSTDSYESLFENQEIYIILKYTQDTYKNDTREMIVILNEKEQYLSNDVESEYFREAVNRNIDNDGFIYNLNKTFSIGMSEITIKRFIIRTSWGKYIVTMEYVINNNDNLPINWKFSGTNKGNMIGTIVTNGRERIWMGKASNYTDKYIDQHIESGTLQAKSEFTAAVNFSFDTQYEDPKLKENEMMDFTIYYSQNNIDSELSIIINEK